MISRTVLRRSICPQCQYHKVVLGASRPAARLYPRLYHQTSRLYPNRSSILSAYSSLSSVVDNTLSSSSILRGVQTRLVSTKKPAKPSKKPSKKPPKSSKTQKKELKPVDPFLAQFQDTYTSNKNSRTSAAFHQFPDIDTPPLRKKAHPPIPSSPVSTPSTPPKQTDESKVTADIATLEKVWDGPKPRATDATNTSEGDQVAVSDKEPTSPHIAVPGERHPDCDGEVRDGELDDSNDRLLDDGSQDRGGLDPFQPDMNEYPSASVSEEDLVRDYDDPRLSENAEVADIPMADEQAPPVVPDAVPVATQQEPAPTKKKQKKKPSNAATKRAAREKRVWEMTGRHLSTSEEIGAVTLGKPAMALIVKPWDGNTPIPIKKKATVRPEKGEVPATGKGKGKQVEKAAAVKGGKVKTVAARKEKEKKENKTAAEEETEGSGSLVIHEEGLFTATEDQPSTVDTMLAQSQASVTDEDIIKNIDQLRPSKAPMELSQTDYNDLFNLLHRGFTRSQIEQYLDHFPKEGEDASQTPPWIVSFPQYAPDTQNISMDVEASRRSPTALTKKGALVIHILTDLWHLTLPGAQSGYLDIRLREAEFGLLLAGTQRALRFMARFYLTEGGRIEAFPEAKTIRVVAPRAKAYRILEEMNSLLSDTDCRKIALSEMPKTSTFDKLIKELGRMTTTYIRHDIKKKEASPPPEAFLLVHWINLTDRPAHLENLRDTVYRFLLSSFYKWPGSSSRLCFWPDQEDQIKGLHFLEPEHERLKWVWHRRLGRWVRWVREIPVMREAKKELSSKSKPNKPPPPPPVPQEILVKGWSSSAGATPEKGAYTSSGWSTTLHSTTRATFGHVLIPNTTEALEPPVPTFERQPSPRMLSPITPPIQSLIGMDHAMGLDDVTLLLRFIPRQSPGGAKSNARPADAPPLEVRLKVVGDEVREAISMRAILADRATDILFPAAVVDARVFQDRYVEFNSHALESHEKLQEFLKMCEFNMERGSLATPSKIHVPIPSRLFINRDASASTEEEPLDETNLKVEPSFKDEEVEVEYIFAGMELRKEAQSIWTPGVLLLYTSIEGGKGGGHRAEFSLVVDPVKDRVLDISHSRRPADPEKEFLVQIGRIANGEGFSWLATPELEGQGYDGGGKWQARG